MKAAPDLVSFASVQSKQARTKQGDDFMYIAQ